MKRTVEPKVLYFGTPVVLISSRNPDGTTNLAPMSSAWWLGYHAMLGMGTSSQTVQNLTDRPELVLNLVDPAMVAALDRIALLTGSEQMSASKRARGYRYEPDKFTAAGLTRSPGELTGLDTVEESPITLEGQIEAIHPIGDPGNHLCALAMKVEQVQVREDLLLGDRYVDPLRWDPLIMKFTEYFAGGAPAYESSLARGWQMPPLRVG
ncbi:flavin reductase family protein [Kribbella sandramycini]|uniref:Flavin reductase (DIM6/NTAB) family NADH-FMN oxidoreductase RutF n=1 Tax=Kribbella sandramycini TaxID=60450 RepID=A0A7Y4NZK2_9ACTN|nr:flavin reductase family protein [Kribbella sandramycini]MBB6567319.1 flavin reductase (DIM6/NTAB) family NADH-FMN oxidoreductase RutF [Kribbella sandramycini]NOL40069.1 flavin reductase family protein [Kribbella sandramycini]